MITDPLLTLASLVTGLASGAARRDVTKGVTADGQSLTMSKIIPKKCIYQLLCEVFTFGRELGGCRAIRVMPTG